MEREVLIVHLRTICQLCRIWKIKTFKTPPHTLISIFHEQRQNITQFRWKKLLLAKSDSASAWCLFVFTSRRFSKITSNIPTVRILDSLVSFHNLKYLRLGFRHCTHWNNMSDHWEISCRVIKWIIKGDITVLNWIIACKCRCGKALRSEMD